MALGKARPHKRPSTSYASTVTTAVFIAMCVLGVWMLTSNSVGPPQTTTRTSTSTVTTADSGNAAFSSSGDAHISNSASFNKKDSPVFEDNPGDLPDDAIKSDEPRPQSDAAAVDEKAHQEFHAASSESFGKNDNYKQESGNESENQVSEESSMTQTQQAEVTSGQSENQKYQEEENAEQNKPEIKTEKIPEEESKGVMNMGINVEDQNQNHSGESESSENTKDQSQKETSDETEKEQSQQETSTQEPTDDEGNKNGRPQQAQTSTDTARESQTPSTLEQVQTQPENQESQKESEPEPEPDERSPTKQIKPGEFDSGAESGTREESNAKSWSTQADQSDNQNGRSNSDGRGTDGSVGGYTWQLCNVTAGTDYIPCLDNEKAIRKLRTRKHYEHRERHCPEEAPTCLVPLPEAYKKPIEWPQSREKIWYHNVPHTKLAEVKGHQNWVKVTGEFLTFPGGGTQFIHGALHYIDFVEKAVPKIAWGKQTRVILDVGCGVASFGGFLFDRDVLAMSFAPKDEHEAQVQFALERGIPAISAVMGSQRLPFPSRVFDLVHCARCRVPWHVEGGALLLELNRVLRPGGYFVWSATPVYQTLQEDVEIWKEMKTLTKSMCWELVTIRKDKLNSVGAAVYRKPTSNDCYDSRKHSKPPICKGDDDPNAAWYVPLQSCVHRVPVEEGERGTKWPEQWPRRLQMPPYWLNSSQTGVYGKPAPDDFTSDFDHWKRVVSKSYLTELGITWSAIRNVMDMRAVYGGFAAALRNQKVWVMNVVNTDSPDTLPIIYERGLFGIYHDWCESFSTYPRTYDLLHADHLFSRLQKRCTLVSVLAEVDRIVRPGGRLIVRDEPSATEEVEGLLKSLHWNVHVAFSSKQEIVLAAQKSEWRPSSFSASS